MGVRLYKRNPRILEIQESLAEVGYESSYACFRFFF